MYKLFILFIILFAQNVCVGAYYTRTITRIVLKNDGRLYKQTVKQLVQIPDVELPSVKQEASWPRPQIYINPVYSLPKVRRDNCFGRS